MITTGGCGWTGAASARHSRVKLVLFQGLNGDEPGRIGFKLGLIDGLLVAFVSVAGLVLGVVATLFFFSLALVFEGMRLLLTPSRPRFMTLAGVMGAMVSPTSAKLGFFGSALEGSLGGGGGLAGGGMEKSCPAPAKLEATVVGVEVADLVPRLRTTTEAFEDLRLGAGLFEESSSLEDALRLLEVIGAGGCWVYAPSHGLVRGETSKSVSAATDVI